MRVTKSENGDAQEMLKRLKIYREIYWKKENKGKNEVKK